MQWKWIIFFCLNTICSVLSGQSEWIKVAASDKYKSPSFIKKIIAGSNYRKEWETPVVMPVFNLQRSKFKIKEMGGGQQTTSLYLTDENNHEWVLRSVDKEVKPSGKFLRISFLQKIIQDHVSAAYPYAGLSVAHISKAAGVVAGDEQLCYVPADTAFGEYAPVMANKVFLLIKYQPDTVKEIETDEMMQKLRSGNQFSVDQKEYLKARLVDWLVSDWDRHDDQWRWIEKNTATGIKFHAVPRDRDQAFFKSTGWLVKFLSLFFLPQLRGFRNSDSDIKSLSFKSKKLDKQLTDKLTEEDWKAITREFQNRITDEVIETAIKLQPREIFAIRGNEMINILKSRRNSLMQNVMKYHASLYG